MLTKFGKITIAAIILSAAPYAANADRFQPNGVNSNEIALHPTKQPAAPKKPKQVQTKGKATAVRSNNPRPDHHRRSVLEGWQQR